MSAVSTAHFECFVPRKLLRHTTASLGVCTEHPAAHWHFYPSKALLSALSQRDPPSSAPTERFNR